MSVDLPALETAVQHLYGPTAMYSLDIQHNPVTPKFDPKIVMRVNKLKIYGNELDEDIKLMLTVVFETQIYRGLSTLESIDFAIKKAIENTKKDKDAVFTLLSSGTRTYEDILSTYSKYNEGGYIDEYIYNTVYNILMEMHIEQKVKDLIPKKGLASAGKKQTLRKFHYDPKANRRVSKKQPKPAKHLFKRG
jgi:DNA-binding PadR family transcriptional regulator